nr:Na+ dependent nucleoside transporter N-terminal domain-containing protein [Yersinia sp. 2105 StPb PI]
MALITIAALVLLASHDRRNIQLHYIFQLLIIEIALAYFFLHSESG